MLTAAEVKPDERIRKGDGSVQPVPRTNERYKDFCGERIDIPPKECGVKMELFVPTNYDDQHGEGEGRTTGPP
jgi:hypothetical protein